MKMPNEDLVGFLMGAPAPVAEAVTVAPDTPMTAPAAEIIATTLDPEIPIPQPDEEMRNLMSWMKRIGMCAKDMHYRCKGKPFYGLHELADLVYEVEHETDQIAEIYFLGERGIEPPRMADVCSAAASLPVNYPSNDKYFIGGTMNACLQTMHKIEDIKKNFPDLKSGTVAVLDAISQHCLLAIGLLDQTMKG
jgi:hypothetical protein